MTEKNVFRAALITLGSTFAVPVVVATTGLGMTGGLSASDSVKSYIASAHAQATASQSQGKGDTTQSGASHSSSTPSDDQKSASTAAPAAVGAKAASTYTVKAGDTYGCIAEQYYGSYEQWPKVYAVNSMYPGYEEYHLNVGAVVQLPAISSGEVLPQTRLCR